ncbi:unnamed protein product [Schistosoma rodhaini]|nr:unnamed protein product [Schistosoma rodhaini]
MGRYLNKKFEPQTNSTIRMPSFVHNRCKGQRLRKSFSEYMSFYSDSTFATNRQYSYQLTIKLSPILNPIDSLFTSLVSSTVICCLLEKKMLFSSKDVEDSFETTRLSHYCSRKM